MVKDMGAGMSSAKLVLSLSERFGSQQGAHGEGRGLREEVESQHQWSSDRPRPQWEEGVRQSWPRAQKHASHEAHSRARAVPHNTHA